MVSVIIPALNKENSIARKCKQVNEVIVVDDCSFDNTVAFAKKAGASVIISTKLGNGSMKNLSLEMEITKRLCQKW